VVFPKPEETCILKVDGMQFRDWESVMVKHEMYVHPYIHYRFTCSEGMPLAKNWAALRIVPGMTCTVELAGNLACTGEVSTRQVYVDSRRHHIEIQGVSTTEAMANNSVVHKSGEEKDVTYQQFAEKLLKPLGLNLKVIGGSLPSVKFPRISIPPGSTVLEALEIPLRALKGVAMTSNPQGDLVLAVGPDGGGDTVYEGNLGRPSYIEANEIFYNSGIAKGLSVLGQRLPTDKDWGPKPTSGPYQSSSGDSLAGKGASQQAIPLEMPAWTDDFLKGRGSMEQTIQGNNEVTVYVTVNGWTKPSGGLWKIDQIVRVVSPMLVLNGSEELKTKSVTFEQDDRSGTRTTLELCNQNALSGFKPQQ